MATLPNSLQRAVQQLKAGPVVLVWDADGTPLEIYLASADITFTRELIQLDHSIIGAFEVYVSMQQLRIDVAALNEDSADIMKVLLGTGDGYVHSATAEGFGSAAGKPLRASAKKVVLKPYEFRAVETYKVEVWKMFVDGDVTKSFGKESNEWGATLASLADAAQQDGMLHAKFTLPVRPSV